MRLCGVTKRQLNHSFPPRLLVRRFTDLLEQSFFGLPVSYFNHCQAYPDIRMSHVTSFINAFKEFLDDAIFVNVGFALN